jgi:O-antigen ligase
MQATELAIAGTNAHNVVLDGLVKFGLLGTIPILAIFVVATILAIKSTRLGVVLPMGLLGTYLILGLAEADTEWMRITQPWLWLVLAVLLAGRVVQDQSPHPLPLSSGEWSGSRS